VFNRSFQIRSRKGGLVSGDVLQELADRASDRNHFYRPKRRPRPGVKAKGGKLQGIQLELFGVDGQPTSAKWAPSERTRLPLCDLFPTAYGE